MTGGGEAEGGRRDWMSGEESDGRESSRTDQETDGDAERTAVMTKSDGGDDVSWEGKREEKGFFFFLIRARCCSIITPVSVQQRGHRGKEGRREQRHGLWQRGVHPFYRCLWFFHVVESYGKKRLEFGGLFKIR